MKRYDFQPGYTCNEDCHAEMIENLTGNYILFDDYKILRLKYVETLTRTEQAESERDALREQIEEVRKEAEAWDMPTIRAIITKKASDQ